MHDGAARPFDLDEDARLTAFFENLKSIGPPPMLASGLISTLFTLLKRAQ